MVSVAAGEYVKHTDHLAAVSAARADALRWVLGRLEPRKQSHCDCESCYRFNSGYNACMDDVRAIIEKELEK